MSLHSTIADVLIMIVNAFCQYILTAILLEYSLFKYRYNLKRKSPMPLGRLLHSLLIHTKCHYVVQS